MGKLTEDIALRDKRYVFEDRIEAGCLLAHALMHLKSSDCIVLAIPSGGLPFASEIADALAIPMDLVIVRKIQIPLNTEAGFGAMAPDGDIILNEKLLLQLNLTGDEINRQAIKTSENIRERNQRFREGRPYIPPEHDTVIIVDDGLASGYTMLAAIRFVKRTGAQKRIVAGVPTGSKRTVNLVLPEVDELVCLNVRSGFPFAVADAYRNWHDLTDKEALAIVKKRTGIPMNRKENVR